MSGPDRPPVRRVPGPRPWLPVLAPARGRSAVAAYLRAHLYGAAVGRSLLDRCAAAVEPADRALLLPLRDEFDDEIDVARQLLSRLSPVGTPGRRLLRLGSGVSLALLPAGPGMLDPLTRLGALEALRTLVVAKRSMWELLADSWAVEDPSPGAAGPTGDAPSGREILLALAERAAAQEALIDGLRRTYGLAAFA